MIEYGDDYILILDDQGEIVKWLKSEWIDNPELVFSMCNAVKLHTEGRNLREILK